MISDAMAAKWIRCCSAFLVAWCAFWGGVGAVMSGFNLMFLTGWIVLSDPGPTAGYVYLGVLAMASGLLSFFTTRWQWRCMARSTSRDHTKLIVVLLIIGVALMPQPFTYASF